MEGSSQLHAPVALPPGKEIWFPLDRRLGGHQSWFGHGGEEENMGRLSTKYVLKVTFMKCVHFKVLKIKFNPKCYKFCTISYTCNSKNGEVQVRVETKFYTVCPSLSVPFHYDYVYCSTAGNVHVL
jgi:hypothetical protein